MLRLAVVLKNGTQRIYQRVVDDRGVAGELGGQNQVGLGGVIIPKDIEQILRTLSGQSWGGESFRALKSIGRAFHSFILVRIDMSPDRETVVPPRASACLDAGPMAPKGRWLAAMIANALQSSRERMPLRDATNARVFTSGHVVLLPPSNQVDLEPAAFLSGAVQDPDRARSRARSLPGCSSCASPMFLRRAIANADAQSETRDVTSFDGVSQ